MGRSNELRCAVDPDSASVVIQDDKLPLSKSKYRVWAKALTAPVPQSQFDAVDKALVRRDIVAMRRLFRATFHRCVHQVRIISQPEGSASSTHLSWFGGIQEPAASGGTGLVARCCITAGPHTNFAVGMTMVIRAHGELRQWLGHTSLFVDGVVEDRALWEQHGRALQSAVHGVETPRREELALTESGSPASYGTPSFPLAGQSGRALMASGNPNEDSLAADEFRCCACDRPYPAAILHAVSACAHRVCYKCATACAAKHVRAPCATPSNMPCPAEMCDAVLTDREVKSLVPSADFAVLEFNEVRVALADGVVCPSCTSMFDRVLNDMPANDPLREKFVCGVCGTDFCAECNEAPFHHGRGCRVVHAKSAPKCRFCGNQAAKALSASPPPPPAPLPSSASAPGDSRNRPSPASSRSSSCEPAKPPTPATERSGGYPSTPAPAKLESIPWHVCDADSCVERAKKSCNTVLPCGHLCCGSNGERTCTSCLDPECASRHKMQEGDDLCAICYVETLSEAPCIELACGHVLHLHCVEEKLAKRWPTARITFAFLDCPLCGVPMQHNLIANTLQTIHKFRDNLEGRYLERLKIEGLEEHEGIVAEASPHFGQPLAWARENLTYFECFKCHKPYFGGLKECQGADREEPNREELVCGGCASGSASCPKHGGQYLEFKCKYCCNLAVWFCWGTTHFCDLCHSPPRKTVRVECPGEELCPLKAKHLPNGQECAIGCALCRSHGK
eukprot:CAMPEP_0174834588 /NCGR_PEP_ID=MMETSP1114-20130205/4908_1 /TAXON_ID=312471 /ORGANISM="Neobodo designis, Strain CCAP 1951/1" /LENGTH=735 /DNA_ID=CAMNT_0016068503 /DNA_START=129 /DNA_END=2336 /DNA_ORIENTATION=+